MAQEIANSTLLDTWASGGNIVEPDISKIIEGWQLGEQPPHEYMNWLQNTFGSKLNHILKNGVANWNNETEYLAGSSVQHNGNVWLCKATNTNSAPTDVNANWKRIITVESLTTVLAGYVATTGNQTIAGVKTFSSSPIVPTPTTDIEVANKKYVDDNKMTNKTFAGDLNTLKETGFYQIDATATNKPAAGYFACIVYGLQSDLTGQLLISSTGEVYSRIGDATPTWVSWSRLDLNGLGINQTWQDVTASRAKSVTYTNTTGKPIQVSIVIAGGGGVSGSVQIDSLANICNMNAEPDTLSFIVPDGSTYIVTGTATIVQWSELR